MDSPTEFFKQTTLTSQRRGGLVIVDGDPGRVPMPSRAVAPVGEAHLRQRGLLARLDPLTGRNP